MDWMHVCFCRVRFSFSVLSQLIGVITAAFGTCAVLVLLLGALSGLWGGSVL